MSPSTVHAHRPVQAPAAPTTEPSPLGAVTSGRAERLSDHARVLIAPGGELSGLARALSRATSLLPEHRFEIRPRRLDAMQRPLSRQRPRGTTGLRVYLGLSVGQRGLAAGSSGAMVVVSPRETNGRRTVRVTQVSNVYSVVGFVRKCAGLELGAGLKYGPFSLGNDAINGRIVSAGLPGLGGVIGSRTVDGDPAVGVFAALPLRSHVFLDVAVHVQHRRLAWLGDVLDRLFSGAEARLRSILAPIYGAIGLSPDSSMSALFGHDRRADPREKLIDGR